MKSCDIRDIMSGKRRSIFASIARLALAAVSLPYGFGMSLRRMAYRIGLCKSHKVSVPVICIGNITAGGTGKTPMAAWVVKSLIDAGKKPAILTRGYKAVAGLSDEADLLADITGVKVFTNPDRLAGAKKAIASGANILVMDDGFQHLRLHRDLDIVLIDARNPFGYNWVLPRGMLRERLSALGNSDAIIITHSDCVDSQAIEKLTSKLEHFAHNAKIYRAIHKPQAVIDNHGNRMPLESLKNRQFFAFAGIANPEGFFDTLRSLDADLAGTLCLEDHTEYTKSTLDALNAHALTSNAKAFITTQKDFTKLKNAKLCLPLWQLAIEIQIIDDEKGILSMINKQ